MRIAVTGATGFIGKNLVTRHLEMGDEIRILSRKLSSELDFPKEVGIYNADLCGDIENLNLFVEGVDILYHCAAEIRDESKMFRVNVEGTNNLIQSAKGKVRHWVQLSSTGAYGPILEGTLSEGQMVNPTNAYEKSKVDSDKLIVQAGLNNFFTYSILRPSNVFGADMKNQSLFQLVKAIDKGLFFFIGPPGANANYIPVENVVHALTLLGKNERAKGKIFNVSDSLPMETFINVIAKLLNKSEPKKRLPLSIMKALGQLGDLIPKSPLTSGRIDALSSRVKYENNLITRELGYAPLITMQNGIEKLVAAYRSMNE